MKLLTAVISQLPAIVAVEEASVVPLKLLCQLLATESIVDGDVSWPLHYLHPVPELVPQQFFLFLLFAFFRSFAQALLRVVEACRYGKQGHCREKRYPEIPLAIALRT